VGTYEIPFGAAPVEHFCGACGARAAVDERFCGACGTATGDPPGAVVDAAYVSDEPVTVGATRRGRGRTAILAAAAFLTASLVAAVAYLGVSWRAEIHDRRQLAAALSTTQAKAAGLERERASLTERLNETTALAERRAQVLARAQRALAQVTPLLSSVDAVRTVTSKMQESRGSYAAAAETLKDDLIGLANYLLDVDPEYIDYYYLDSAIDRVNGEISTFNYYGGELTSHDDDYAAATERFETKATLFTEAVEALKNQLAKDAGAK